VQRGVYAVGHPKLMQDGRRMAAVLTFGADAALSGRAAADHWAMLRSTAVEVTVPRTVRPRSAITLHSLPLPPDEITTHEGMPVTTVTRTIFDLGIYGRRAVEKALANAEAQQLTDALTLDDLLERYPHRKGTGTIRAVRADERAPLITETGIEDLLLDFLEARGFPRPRAQAWVFLGDRWIRADFVYDRERVILEVDGGTHATELGRASDNSRDAAAQAERWRIFRIAKRALLTDPDTIEADLRRLLATPPPSAPTE
jgi:very-short-patch-repair endonuclease